MFKIANVKAAIIVAALAAGLAGCVNPVKPVQGLPAEEISRISIVRVEVVSASDTVPAEVQAGLKAALEKHLAN